MRMIYLFRTQWNIYDEAFWERLKLLTIFAKKRHCRCSTGFWILPVLKCFRKLRTVWRRHKEMWDWKNTKYKDHAWRTIEESYICIECLEVLLKGNRDKKYTSLCRKDDSRVKRHKYSWHKGSNSSTCIVIPSAAPEITALWKQYKDQ